MMHPPPPLLAEAEQEAKRRKLDEGKEPVAEEAPKELEQDDPLTKKVSTLSKQIDFKLGDCTLNVVPVVSGRVLTPLTDGGLQFLVAGARASAGVKSGRYMFEAQILEGLSTADLSMPRNVPQPRQLLRVGVATRKSSLFLAESELGISFDSEGFTSAAGQKTQNGRRFRRGQTVGVLINLDPSSPNKDTLSLFLDGVRATAPVPLPEAMKGQPLFPVINFKNLTVHVNFGPAPLAALPFSCRMLQEAAAADVVHAPDCGPNKDGKYEVLFPVGLPEEATFDWLDAFLAKNPQYCELSDRSILKWAECSGLPKPSQNWRHSVDKPDVSFGIPLMDDFSARRVLDSVVAAQPRNYVVMEVKGNLVPQDRTELMKRFSSSLYKKVAQVVVGVPDDDFKQSLQAEMLREKQEVETQAWKVRKAEKERKKLMEAQMRQLEGGSFEELQRRKEEALRAVEKNEDEMMEGDVKTEVKDETEIKEEEKVEVKEEVEEEEAEPVAALTPAELELKFRKKAVPDVVPAIIAAHLGQFALPQKEEGFDDLKMVWGDESSAQEYFKNWLLRQKVLCRIDDLVPGEYFRTRWAEWQRVLGEWHQLTTSWSDPVQQAYRQMQAAQAAQLKADEEAAKKAAAAAEEVARKIEADAKAETAAEEAKADGAAEQDGEAPAAAAATEGGEAAADPAAAAAAPASEEAAAASAEAGAVAVAEAAPVSLVDADPMSVPDILNIGEGEPMFAKFSFEDWALLSLRLELVLLANSFKKDSQDEERQGIHESHLAFYYNKYFMKQFNVRYYGVDSTSGLVDMIKDAVQLTEDGVLATSLPDDFAFETFVRRTEVERRHRNQRLLSGDESARLVFNKAPEVPQQQAYGGYRGVPGPPPARGGPYGAVPGPPPPPSSMSYQQMGKGGAGCGGGGYGGGKGVGGGGGGYGGGQICRNFRQYGTCRYGDTCRFSH